MKCQTETTHRLSRWDLPDDEQQQLVKHLENCNDCRKLAEKTFAEQWASLPLRESLSAVNSDDLKIPSYDSKLDWEAITKNSQVVGDQEEQGPTLDSTPNSSTYNHAAQAIELLETATHPELLGRIGRYDVEGVLGSGGTGVVFRAFDKDLHRIVAIKVLNRSLATNAAARKRFNREAQAAAAVLHPNVLPIHNVEPDAETPFLVMQYVPGQSLQARIERDGPLEIEDALRIAKQTAEALAAAHLQGLIHRDVKPANILLEDETDRAVLGDFGLARTSDDASLTRTGIVAGTPHYMSPEQASGEPIGPSSDIFSLGSVIFAMLAGRPPFRADSAMGVLHCVCTKKPDQLHKLNNRVPRELSHLVTGLLAKKPSARPHDASVVAKELETLLSRYQRGKLRLAPQSSPYRRTLLTSGVIILCVACGVVLWGYINSSRLYSQKYQREVARQESIQRALAQNEQAGQIDRPNPAYQSAYGRTMPPSKNRATGVVSANRFQSTGTASPNVSSLSLPSLPSLPNGFATGRSVPANGDNLAAPENSGIRNPWDSWDRGATSLLSELEELEQQRSYPSTINALQAESKYWEAELTELSSSLDTQELSDTPK